MSATGRAGLHLGEGSWKFMPQGKVNTENANGKRNESSKKSES